MRGFPPSFATKQDYLNGLEMYPAEARAALRQLLADRFVWKEAGELAEGEEGKIDSTHIVSTREGSAGPGLPVRIQMELVEDANARLFRLGFTVEELEGLLS